MMAKKKTSTGSLSFMVFCGLIASQAHSTVISTGTVTDLSVQIAGLPASSCSGNDVGQQLSSLSGQAVGSAQLGSVNCTLFGNDVDLSIAGLTSTTAVADPTFALRSGDSESQQYAYWLGSVFPGATAGTSLSINVSYDYSYLAAVTGFDLPVNHPLSSASEFAQISGNVFLIGISSSGDFEPDVFRQSLFGFPSSDLSWNSTTSGLVQQQTPPQLISGSGQFSDTFEVTTPADAAYFWLGASVATNANQTYAVPEPATASLFGLSMLVIGFMSLRSKRRAVQ